MWKKEVLLISILFGSLLVSRAQTTFDPNISLRNTSISQWTANTGLVSNNLTDVYQSTDGLLWITSYNGLMVFDGERIEVYDKSRLDFLRTDGFHNIEEADHGKIYLSSQGSGVIVYDNKSFYELDPLGDVLPKGIPTMYYSEKQNSMYFGSNNEGVFRLTNDTISKVNIPQFKQSSIRTMVEDNYGSLWIGSEGDGLVCVKEGVVMHYTTSDGLLANIVSSLAINEEGDLLIGTVKGLQIFNENAGLFTIEELKDTYINCLFVDGWNSVWVGTELGVYRWNKKAKNIDWVKSKRNIDLVRINSISTDREGNLWLTSNRSGLLQLKESNIYNWSEPFIESDRVYKVHESWTGDFYVGSDENSLNIISGEQSTKYEIKTNLRGNGVRDIYHDQDSSLWLATYVGIIHIKEGVETVYSTNNGLLANNFRVIHKDRLGNFWFGSRSGGLVKMRDGKIIKTYSNSDKLTSNFIFSIKEDSNGNILVGSYSGGLNVIKPSGEVEIFYLKNNDSVVLLFNIDVLPDNTAIVMSNTGPLYFDGKTLKPVLLQKGLRSKACFDAVIDNMNHIWITSNIGVMRIDRDEWERFIANEKTELSYTLFDENNGMNNKECTGTTSSTMSKQGNIYIPTLGGVCIVDPSSIKENSVKPDVVIRKVEIDQKDYLRTDVREIPAGSLRFTFEFSALSFYAPEKNQYRYKLEGLDEDWSEVVYDGKVEYTNLRPGVYTFKVIGSNDSNIWDNEGDYFKFRVKTRFYETFWFFILVLTIVVIVLIIVYKWRTSFINRQNRELKKVNSELDRFVYSTSHEMRSPLSSILGLVNIARSDKENTIEYLDHIENSVLKLDSFIHDIMDFSKNARLDVQLKNIDLEALIYDLFHHIEYNENIEAIDFKVSDDGKTILRSDEERVKIVCGNLLNNAFRHHDPKNIDHPYVYISISTTSDGVVLTFKDNGPGIKEQHKNKIFKMFYRGDSRSEGSGLGLYIVEEIVSKLNGSLEMVSKEKQGAIFKLFLPNLL